MNGFTFDDCKSSALVCVDEILDVVFDYTGSDNRDYWEEVKKEIEKL